MGSRGRRRGQASFAHIALHSTLTAATRHVAAPVVLAVAPLNHAIRVGVVAAPTAHEIAAVTAIRGLVALPVGEGREKGKRSVSTPPPQPLLENFKTSHSKHCSLSLNLH